MKKILIPLLLLYTFSWISCQPTSTETPPEETTTAQEPAPEQPEIVVSPNRFEEAVRKMKTITYELKEFQEKPISENFLNQRIRDINTHFARTNKTLLDTLDMDNLVFVRSAFIKSTTDMGGNLYARASLESLEFSDETSAQQAYAQILEVKEKHPWDVISKSPITFFLKGREVVLIIPGGFYMLDKVAEIEGFLMENL